MAPYPQYLLNVETPGSHLNQATSSKTADQFIFNHQHKKRLIESAPFTFITPPFSAPTSSNDVVLTVSPTQPGTDSLKKVSIDNLINDREQEYTLAPISSSQLDSYREESNSVVFERTNPEHAEEVRHSMFVHLNIVQSKVNEVYIFKPLTYDNYEYNKKTAQGFLEFMLGDPGHGTENSMRMLLDQNIHLRDIEQIHFLFYNVFVIAKGIFFKIAWSTEDHKVYICTDCEKKLVSCKMVYDPVNKKLINIERRVEPGCFDHQCSLDDIQARYNKVRLGKYRHERKRLLKKPTQQDPTVMLMLKNLDKQFKQRQKESDALFKIFQKEKFSIQKFKINELVGEDRRLNFFLHIMNFIKVLFEKYHAQLNLKRHDTPKALTPILVILTLQVRLNATRAEFDHYCKVTGEDPKETYRVIVHKLRSRTERQLKGKSNAVGDKERDMVDQILGKLSNFGLNG